MSGAISEMHFADTKARAVFAADGPAPQFLIDTPRFKALVVGLEAGQQVPLHSAEVALYHFLEGSGLMTVSDESFEIKPGVTVIAPGGAPRSTSALPMLRVAISALFWSRSRANRKSER